MVRRRVPIEKVRAVALGLGVERLPVRVFLERSGVGHAAIYGLFRSWTQLWREAPFAFRGWAAANAPDFPRTDQLPVTPEPERKDGARAWHPSDRVAEDLGFLIEAAETGFPDGGAKRQAPDGSWRRARIEFAYRGRAFRDRGGGVTEGGLARCPDPFRTRNAN